MLALTLPVHQLKPYLISFQYTNICFYNIFLEKNVLFECLNNKRSQMSKLNHIINRFYYLLLLFQSNYNNKTFISKGLNFGILSKNGFPLNICTVGYFKSLSKSVAFEPPPRKKVHFFSVLSTTQYLIQLVIN